MNKTIVLIFFLASCSQLNRESVSVKTNKFNLRLVNYQKSLPGTFLLGLFDISKYYERPTVSELVALTSEGTIDFSRSFSSQTERMGVMDFKLLEPHIYSYTLANVQGWRCSGTTHFLSLDWSDYFQPRSRNGDADLDCHEVVGNSDGSYFYTFYRKPPEEKFVRPEIQGVNSKGLVFFRWQAAEHLTDLAKNPSEKVDPFHLNSIDPIGNDALLLSLNGADEVTKISLPSGKVSLRLSRNFFQFKNDPFDGFQNQHDVRFLPNGNILMFDNGSGNRPSRAVEYQVDELNKTATLVWEYRAQFKNSSRISGGSVQRLKNGNTLIGWGWATQGFDDPIFTEVNAKGEKVRELFGDKTIVSYRVYFKQ